MIGLQCKRFVGRDLIIAKHAQINRRVKLADALDQVVRETVVVIDKEDHVNVTQLPWGTGKRPVTASRLVSDRFAFVVLTGEFHRALVARPQNRASC